MGIATSDPAAAPDPTAAPDPVEYLDRAAASATGRDYKRRLLDALDLRPGQVVIDVGCGPGTDLPAMASAVTGIGAVIGLDLDPAMRSAARQRIRGVPAVSVVGGDAHALPLRAESVDRVRFDRVLQHVADPARTLAEVRRVLRPGGLVGLAEPDWGTLAIDDVDEQTSGAFTRFVAGRVRNSSIGRQLPRLATRAGLAVRGVEATAVVYRDPVEAEQILGLRRNLSRAIAAGAVDETAGRRWLERVSDGPALASFTFYTITASA